MLKQQLEAIGKRIVQVKDGMEDAFRMHLERSVAAPGGALKEMLASIEQMAKEWKEAAAGAALPPAEGGEDAKETREEKDATERTRAAALMKVIEEFAGQVRTLHSDVKRAREAQRKSVSVAAVVCVLLAAPVLLGIGLGVQHQFTLLPEPARERGAEQDPQAEWRSYVWERYGQSIVECERKAVETGAPVPCELRMFP